MVGVLVSQSAPDFNAAAVLNDGQVKNDFNLHNFIADHYALLLFYPLDFTFVCPSELIALNNRIAHFEKLGVKVITISVDSQFTHVAWRNTPVDKGGIGHVKYTMVADVSHDICRAYGIEHPQAKVALRAAFLLDKKGVVRAQVVNDLPLGRNIDELIRLVEAWQFFEENGEVCPAGWNPGSKGMEATAEGVATYLKSHADKL